MRITKLINNIKDIHVAISGVGKVGGKLAKLLVEAGARITAASINLELINELEIRDGQTFKVGERIELNGQDDTQLIIISPDGTKFKLQVSNAGALSATEV